MLLMSMRIEENMFILTTNNCKQIYAKTIQCDQMLNLKSCPNVFKSCLNYIHSSFYIN